MRRRPLLLVVEDDKVLRDLYRVSMSLSDFEVHACEDGLDALHYLDQTRPDVIVLDLDLPRISGTVLYDEMLARPRAQRVPIVVVSGMENIPDLADAVVLRKPVPAEQLIRVIESTLARRDREWLYVHGPHSVLITRVAFPGPAARLQVLGPGEERNVFECPNLVDCLSQQAEIERGLLAEGYLLLALDRRSGRDRRTIARAEPDRRSNFSELNT